MTLLSVTAVTAKLQLTPARSQKTEYGPILIKIDKETEKTDVPIKEIRSYPDIVTITSGTLIQDSAPVIQNSIPAIQDSINDIQAQTNQLNAFKNQVEEIFRQSGIEQSLSTFDFQSYVEQLIDIQKQWFNIISAFNTPVEAEQELVAEPIPIPTPEPTPELIHEIAVPAIQTVPLPDSQFIKGSATAYNLTGTTASGIQTTHGICAGKSAWLGKTIKLYQRLPDQSIGQVIGIYKCMDTGGTNAIKTGQTIDVWCADPAEVQDFANLTYSNSAKGKIYIEVLPETNPESLLTINDCENINNMLRCPVY